MKAYSRAVLAVCVVSLVAVMLPQSAGAAMINGTFGFATLGIGSYDTGSNPSVTFSSLNFINTTGDSTFNGQPNLFSSLYPLSPLKFVTVTPLTVNLSGIGSSQTPYSIPDLFVFDSTSSRFHFDLSSLSYSLDGMGRPMLAGVGTLRDITGEYSDSPATFSQGWSGPNNYAVSFAATPEPATLSLLVLGGLAMLRRRRK